MARQRAPGGAAPQNTQINSAEIHRHDRRRRDVLAQCATCHVTATARIDSRGFTSRSIRAVDSITRASGQWSASPGEKSAAALREARRLPVTWYHADCGGQLRSYDIQAASP